LVYRLKKVGWIGSERSGSGRKPVLPAKTLPEIDFEDYFSEDFRFENKKCKVTVVVPALNEERNIGHTIAQLYQNGFRDVLVVDGSSRDRTVEVAKDLGATVLFQEGRGKGDALRSAFSFEGLGDRVVIMDADGSMDPKEIHSLLDALDDGADVVKASRFLDDGSSEDISPLRRVGNGIFVFLVNRLFGADYTDLCYGFAAFTKQALLKLGPVLESTGFEIETEVFIKARKMGLKIVEAPSAELDRRFGRTNLKTTRDGVKILTTILREAFFR
jgi:glycosyltransferase involved in cell wall biosynthesis